MIEFEDIPDFKKAVARVDDLPWRKGLKTKPAKATKPAAPKGGRAVAAEMKRKSSKSKSNKS